MDAVDLFAGAGGLSEGATQAGAKVRVAVDLWPRALATHAVNHPDTEHRCQDVGQMDPRNLPAHDLLLASPPCQGHSKARGTEKPRHGALRSAAWCVVNIAEVCRPRLLAVENVPEMRDWALFPLWWEALQRLGYTLSAQVLNAADFGVPQERERLFVTGTLAKTTPSSGPWIAPPILAHVPAASFVDFNAGSWSQIDRPGRAPKTLAKIAAGRAALGDRFLVPYYGASRGGRSLARPIGTIATVDKYAVVDGDRMRMLTVAEYRIAMGFPAGYTLTGTAREQTKQLGNAVCPPVAREVVRQLARYA